MTNENSTENTNQENDSLENEASYHAKGLYASVKSFLRDRLSLRDLDDSEKTIEGIQKDIEFGGYNVWILAFGTIICSIGLNVNSIALVIGAMLISPLMGPIMGIGLSIGINDLTTLKKSVKSLGFAVLMAVSASALYFFISPLSDESSELFARTRPTFLDVGVALLGGFTGILAGSRKEKSNVIPGVAIATALLPPLCTAGYGLATLRFEYFFGAFYLFLINTFFIALATILVVRFLRFPVVTFVSKEKESKTRRIILISTLLIIGPSIFVFYQVIKETYFYRTAHTFVENTIYYEGSEIIKKEILYYPDSISQINIAIIGDKIPDPVISRWQNELNNNLEGVRLNVFQGTNEALAAQAELKQLIEVFGESHSASLSKDRKIEHLENRIYEMERTVFPVSLAEELKIQHPFLKEVKMGMMLNYEFDVAKDTVATFMLIWQKDSISESEITKSENRIEQLLAVRLKKDSVFVVSEMR